MLRIGHSKDVHRLKSGKTLRLGGIDIPSTLESVAHSDGDVLLHVVAESLLGALALGDLGSHYPDTDVAHKNLDSRSILLDVKRMMEAKDYHINNIDATVYLETPKLSAHIKTMRAAIAAMLSINITQVSIKATTMEKIDAIGRSEAIGAECVVLIAPTTIQKL